MVTTKNIISVKAKILGLAEAYDLWQQYVVCKSWASMLIQAQLKLLQGNLYDKDKKVFFFIWYSHTTLSLTAERLECLIPAPGVMRSNPAVSGEISRKLYIGGWILSEYSLAKACSVFRFRHSHTTPLRNWISNCCWATFMPSLLLRYLFLGTDKLYSKFTPEVSFPRYWLSTTEWSKRQRTNYGLMRYFKDNCKQLVPFSKN